MGRGVFPRGPPPGTPTGPPVARVGLCATGGAAPRLGEPKLVAGPPKRFAQLIGAVLSVAAVVLGPVLGLTGAALVLVALILVAATLESVFAYCLGCRVFAGLIRIGLVPESVCLECAGVGARLGLS